LPQIHCSRRRPCRLKFTPKGRKDEKSLDKYEEVDKRCYQKTIITLKVDNQYSKGLIYSMNNAQKYKPIDEYYNKVKTGYEEWEFDIQHLNNACKECGYF
jgi:hypothetical protein